MLGDCANREPPTMDSLRYGARQRGTYGSDSVDVPPGSKQRIYSWWQNAIAVAAALLPVLMGVSFGGDAAINGTGSGVGRVVTVVASLAVAAGFGLLALRCARLGVYWRSGGIVIRGLIRTYLVDREDIRDVLAVLVKSLYRSDYFVRIRLVPPSSVSVMLTEEPTAYREAFTLWWLGTVTRANAQRLVNELDGMIRTT